MKICDNLYLRLRGEDLIYGDIGKRILRRDYAFSLLFFLYFIYYSLIIQIIIFSFND